MRVQFHRFRPRTAHTGIILPRLTFFNTFCCKWRPSRPTLLKCSRGPEGGVLAGGCAPPVRDLRAPASKLGAPGADRRRQVLLLPRPHRSPDPHQAEREPHPAAPDRPRARVAARKTRLGRAPAVELRIVSDGKKIAVHLAGQKMRRSAGRSFSISTPPGWAGSRAFPTASARSTGRARRNPGSRRDSISKRPALLSSRHRSLPAGAGN